MMWSENDLKWIEENRQLIESGDIDKIETKILESIAYEKRISGLKLLISIIYLVKGSDELLFKIRSIKTSSANRASYELSLTTTSGNKDYVKRQRSFDFEELSRLEDIYEIGFQVLNIDGFSDPSLKSLLLKLWNECKKVEVK